jgi:O-antigen/teichoic acid export membrane protein
MSYIKEKISHSGFQRYFKNTTWVLFGRIFSLGISFFTTIYVIRHLGPENYGLLAFSVGFVGLFSFIAGLGIDQILSRELAQDITKKDELLGSSLFLKLAASSLSVILILVSTYIVKTDSITRLLILINSFTLIFGSFNIISFFFQAKVQGKYQSISLISVTIILSLLKILVITFNKGIIYFAFVFFLENILYALIGVYIYTKSGNSLLAWRVKKTVIIYLLKDSWPLMISSAFIFIYTRIDQVMLKFITSNFNVGVYDSAVRISEVWYFIPSLIISSVFPAIINARKVSEGMFEKRMIYLYSLMFYMAIAVALPITIFSDFIIKTIYGSAFIGASGVLSVYIWAGIPVFITIAINTYLLTENRTGVSFVSSLVGMVANIILNIWLIPNYGIYGAALATLISYSFIPISIFLFKDLGGQYTLLKKAIFLPFNLVIQKIWNQK